MATCVVRVKALAPHQGSCWGRPATPRWKRRKGEGTCGLPRLSSRVPVPLGLQRCSHVNHPRGGFAMRVLRWGWCLGLGALNKLEPADSGGAERSWGAAASPQGHSQPFQSSSEVLTSQEDGGSSQPGSAGRTGRPSLPPGDTGERLAHLSAGGALEPVWPARGLYPPPPRALGPLHFNL